MIKLTNLITLWLTLSFINSTPTSVKNERWKGSLFKDPLRMNFIAQTQDKIEKETKAVTIRVSYAAIECGCPQWFETKFRNEKFLTNVERFYLEPTNKTLINANHLWNGKKLPLTLKLVGRFSKEKELPITYNTKTTPERARIFWYNKLTVE